MENFKIIQRLPHKISINGLYFILNYKSIFDTVKYMIGNDKDILQVGIVDIGIGKNKYI